MDDQKGAGAGRHTDGAPGEAMVGERHTVATHRHDSPVLKGTKEEVMCQPKLKLCLLIFLLFLCTYKINVVLDTNC